MKESREEEEGEEDDTAERREREVYVCVTSAVEENCLTAIRRLLNDNLLSSLRWLAYPPSPFLGRKHFAFLALQCPCSAGRFHTWQFIFSQTR